MISKKNLILGFSFFLSLCFLTSCSDFASIFKKGGRTHHKGKAVALKKTRGGKGKVIRGFFIWPVQSREVSSGFGGRNGRPHDGIDIRSPKGSSIFASAAGEVVYSDRLEGYGNLILIKHSKNYFTAYAHNSKNLVKEDKKVEQGEKIGEVGDTGNASGYHVHFEIREGSTPMDPMLFLP